MQIPANPIPLSHPYTNPALQMAAFRAIGELLGRPSKHRAGGRAGLAGKAAQAFRRKEAARRDRRRAIAEHSRRVNQRKGGRA